MCFEGQRPRAGASFFKGHGHGNDYLVFEPGSDWDVTPAAVRAVCHPHRGVGSDGIVVLAATEPRVRLRMFNPDGGEFERSGNGLRIAAVAMARWGLAGPEAFVAPFTVDVGGGPVDLRLHGGPQTGVHDASADLGEASVGPAAVALDPALLADGLLTHPERGLLDVVPVSVGNPHLVVFTDDLSDEALESIGPWLSAHPGLAGGANVQLARADGDGLRIRIWERGVGRTAASGTSASAVAVAAVASGRVPHGAHTVAMDGGEFVIGVDDALGVTLRGPVTEVCTGRLTRGYLESMSALD